MVPVLVTLYVFWTILIIAFMVMVVGFLVAERNPTTLLGAEPGRRELLLVTPRVIGIVPMVFIITACFFWPIALVVAFAIIPLRNRKFHRS